jgi:hypothetical protein
MNLSEYVFKVLGSMVVGFFLLPVEGFEFVLFLFIAFDSFLLYSQAFDYYSVIIPAYRFMSF